MQDFINHAAFERAAAFAFTGARARYCLMGLMAAAILAAIGAPLAAIWLGLALLIDEAHKALAAHSASLPAKQGDIATLALDIVAAASFAAAPAMVWSASGPLAIAMLCALAAHGALSAEPRRALSACAPYGMLGLWFAFDGAVGGALGPALIGLACVIYLFANALHHANRAANARRQDAEWVRQLNMNRSDNASAAW